MALLNIVVSILSYKFNKSYCWVSMPSNIHLSKGADIPNSNYFHSEVPKKVYDF